MRAVFDVNVLVRFVFGSGVVTKLLRRGATNELVILSGPELRTELTNTVAKRRLASRVSAPAYERLSRLLDYASQTVEIHPPYPACRDPNDGYLLAMARDGRADFLVTNDQDLLCLKRLGECKIITPEDFSRRLEAPPNVE